MGNRSKGIRVRVHNGGKAWQQAWWLEQRVEGSLFEPQAGNRDQTKNGMSLYISQYLRPVTSSRKATSFKPNQTAPQNWELSIKMLETVGDISQSNHQIGIL